MTTDRTKTPAAARPAAAATASPPPGGTLRLALAGSLLAWAALPPIDAWPLAWIAPVPWLLLVLRPQAPGRPYRTLYLAGFVFWMLALHWLRLPYWATAAGWVALSAYLAAYLPLFVALCRVAVHRLGVSVVVAAPVVWTGLELARGHVLTGFRMAALAHTQYRWTALVQVSDLAGAYAVDFLLVLVAACVARAWWRTTGRGPAVWPLAVAAAAIGAAVLYGHWRMRPPATEFDARIALVQGSIDVEMKSDESKRQEIFDHYNALSREALRRHAPLDAMIWPETMFRDPLVVNEGGAAPPDDWPDTAAAFRQRLDEVAAESGDAIGAVARTLGVPLVLGVETHAFGAGVRRYNSAVLVRADGGLAARYDKMHPVMFGEYMPLEDRFPWLARLTPITSIAAGAKAVALSTGRLALCPSICYESVLSHVIRRQVNQLEAAGTPPNVLANLTNDGWFWGSSELDLHLVCSVFLAIECRRPVVIAANTGFSASIDADGRVRAKGPRRAADVVLAEVAFDARQSLYLRYGDWFAAVCLALALLAPAAALVKARRDATPAA